MAKRGRLRQPRPMQLASLVRCGRRMSEVLPRTCHPWFTCWFGQAGKCNQFSRPSASLPLRFRFATRRPLVDSLCYGVIVFVLISNSDYGVRAMPELQQCYQVVLRSSLEEARARVPEILQAPPVLEAISGRLAHGFPRELAALTQSSDQHLHRGFASLNLEEVRSSDCSGLLSNQGKSNLTMKG